MDPDVNELSEKTNTTLEYGSVIYLNFLDINGGIFYAQADGVKSVRISLLSKKEFFDTNKSERGNLWLSRTFQDLAYVFEQLFHCCQE